jgi:hypothetical protein
MRRREFFVLAGAAVVRPIGSVAETKTYRVGFLSPGGFAPGTNQGTLTDEIARQLARGGFSPGANLELAVGKTNAQAASNKGRLNLPSSTGPAIRHPLRRPDASNAALVKRRSRRPNANNESPALRRGPAGNSSRRASAAAVSTAPRRGSCRHGNPARGA